MRTKCLRDGHKFKYVSGLNLPYVTCSRWFCGASAVSTFAPKTIASDLHNAIPKSKRFPPVQVDRLGNVIESWEEGKGVD